MIITHLLYAAVAPLASASVGFQKLTKDDPRIPRGNTFVDTTTGYDTDGHLRIMLTPPVGTWTVALECPPKSKPGGFALTGEGILYIPGGTYVEFGEHLSGSYKANAGEITRRVFAKKEWYVTAFNGDTHFELVCQGAHQAPTKYLYISTYNNDGTLPIPGCKITSTRTCRVLHPDIVRKLSRQGYRTKTSVEGHIATVHAYNAHLADIERTKQERAATKKLQANSIYLWPFVALAALGMIAYVRSNWK